MDNAIKQVHELVEEHLTPHTVEVLDGHVLVTHKDQTVHDLDALIDKHLEQPRRPTGTSRHDTLDSLVAHAKRHATAVSAAFCALVGTPKIVAVYNYHPAAGVAEGEGGWRDHRAEYAFPVSEQWTRWAGLAGRTLSVTEFAELLEAGISDVREPGAAPEGVRLPGVTFATPTELLTLAQGLSVRVDQQVTEVQRLDNGAATLRFAEEHEARNGAGDLVRVPNGFLLAIAVFVGGPAYAIAARLRYRVKERQITWQVVLHNAEAARRDATTEAAQRFATESGVAVFYGAPEDK